MFANGRSNDSGTLFPGFVDDDFSHDAAVFIIQMADRFIQKQEVERLAECTDKSNPLLLAERKFSGFHVQFIWDTQLLE